MEKVIPVRRPLVGVGAIILRGKKILLGLRKNSHGDGSWALPGGHLEWHETFEHCAIREVTEETGLIIRNIRPVTFTNDLYFDEQKHYVTLFMTADWVAGEAQLLEPEKCQAWNWFAWDDLPQPLFLGMKNLLASGYNLS